MSALLSRAKQYLLHCSSSQHSTEWMDERSYYYMTATHCWATRGLPTYNHSLCDWVSLQMFRIDMLCYDAYSCTTPKRAIHKWFTEDCWMFEKIIHTNISTLQFVCMSSYLAIMNSQNFIQHQKYYWLDRHLLYNLYSKRFWYVPSHLYYNIQSWVLLSVQHHVLTLSLNLNQLKDFSNESKIYVVLMFIITHCTTWG